jgi:Hemoglobin-like flavoprotein
MLSDEMFESPKFKKHATGVIRTVDKAVSMLQDSDLSELVDVLEKLGKRHTRYGVVEAHYPILGNAVLQTLEEAIGDDFTPDVKEAWVEVWGVISKAMIQGAGH